MPRQAMSEGEVSRFRAQILMQASSIVSDGGLSALSMRTLADRLGVTAGALYRYYPNKQELILDFCREALASLRDHMLSIEAQAPDPLAAIEAMLKAYARFFMEDLERFRLLFLEDDSAATVALTASAPELDAYSVLLKQVERAAGLGLIRSSDHDRTAHILWAGVHGVVAIYTTLRDDTHDATEAVVAEMVSTLIRGLRS